MLNMKSLGLGENLKVSERDTANLKKIQLERRCGRCFLARRRVRKSKALGGGRGLMELKQVVGGTRAKKKKRALGTKLWPAPSPS